MIVLNKENIKKAYKELYVIINNFTNEEKEKIPETFILNLKEEMDNQYEFKIDNTKVLLEQNLMVETKAMLVNLYKMYFAEGEEKIFFQKYDKLCYEKVEKRKRELYNPNEIFKKQVPAKEIMQQEEKKEIIVRKNIFISMFEKIKNFFKIFSKINKK